ncbi:MAG TPA: fused MFS/spermidine synthase, partial [Isosphaeraceae bacterium]
PLAAGLVQWFWMPVHLLFFFAAAMACHGELALRRPSPDRLTGFYLSIALGGVLGSLFNAILAPVLFDRMAEYPIAIVLACLVPALAWGGRERLRTSLLLAGAILGLTCLLAADVGGISSTALGALGVTGASGLFLYAAWTLRIRPIAFALSVGAILLGTGLAPGVGGRILRRERNFYGILRVTEDDKARARRLFHGWTLHGQQPTEPGREREPTTYYLPGGPASQVLGSLDSRPDSNTARVAIVGLGIGGLCPYAKPGQSWTFYELDPAVEAVARDASLFTYLRDCLAASVDVVLGDARLRLADAPEHAFDLIALDAFSSDAIPVHLLTREALSLYLEKRAASGLIAYHISTRHLDLEPILGALANERGLVARIRRDLTITPEEKRLGKQPTVWVVLADREADLGPIATDSRWRPARVGTSVWTDDRSSLLDVLKIGRGARGGP